MQISQITVFKDLPDIDTNIRRWLRTDIDQLVLVDYNCPKHTGDRLRRLPVGKDPRVTILVIDPHITGPFFNVAHAKNIGALAAKNEMLFFQDPEVCLSSEFIESIKEEDADEDIEASDIFTFMPTNWQAELTNPITRLKYITDPVYRQFIIRNSLLYNVNGFNEVNFGWNAETVDMLIRLLTIATKPKFMRSDAMPIYRLKDSPSKENYYPTKLATPEESLTSAMEFYDKMRVVNNRAQLGRRFGVEFYTPHIRMYMGGKEVYFNPGEI